jgi:hypothetical protein
MRPRKPCVSDEAPTTATVFGDNNLEMSGTLSP